MKATPKDIDDQQERNREGATAFRRAMFFIADKYSELGERNTGMY